MAAYAEGLGILRDAISAGGSMESDARDDRPCADPKHYNTISTLADVAEVWRRG